MGKHSQDRFVARCFGLALALAVLSRCGYAASALPVVGTSFSVEAQIFRQNLSAQDIAKLEEEVPKDLARIAGDHFGFLRWAPLTVVPAPGIAAAQLRLRLVDVTGASSGASAISLKYSANSGANTIELTQARDKEELYKPWDDQPTHEPERLLSDIRNKLKDQFASDDFRRFLHEAFLKNIALTKQVFIDVQDERVVIPIQRRDLNTENDSELIVRFTSQRPQDTLKDGDLKLKVDGEFHQDPLQGAVRCLVTRFNFPPLFLEQKGKIWHRDIPIVLRPPRLKELEVHMEKYLKHSGTSGSLVLDPN